jgi:hypothetical protein
MLRFTDCKGDVGTCPDGDMHEASDQFPVAAGCVGGSGGSHGGLLESGEGLLGSRVNSEDHSLLTVTIAHNDGWISTVRLRIR